MITRKDLIIYIDMDDTLCDFLGEYRKRKLENDKLEYPQSIDGFFLNLPPLEGAIESYKLLEKHFDVRILTAPSVMNPSCYTEKRLWVEKYLGMDACHKMNICPDKSLLKGEFLIDDSVTKGQLEFEGEFIRFGFDSISWKSIISDFEKLTDFDVFLIKLKKWLRR